MEYSRLVSVSGLPGLFELIASKNDGAIVRSLEDKSTRFISSRIHNFSQLESIEVYTEGDNVNLVDVFHAMEKSSEALPNEKDAGLIKAYFVKVFPAMDFTKVYSSDMKKMIKWFDVLKKNGIEIKLDEEDADDKLNTGDEKEAEEKTEPVQPVNTIDAKETVPEKIKAAKTKKVEVAEGAGTTPAKTATKAAKKKGSKN